MCKAANRDMFREVFPGKNCRLISEVPKGKKSLNVEIRRLRLRAGGNTRRSESRRRTNGRRASSAFARARARSFRGRSPSVSCESFNRLEKPSVGAPDTIEIGLAHSGRHGREIIAEFTSGSGHCGPEHATTVRPVAYQR